jgi:hypothetical protein
MRIIIDTRERPQATRRIEEEFTRPGINFIRSKLPYGDYMSPDNPDIIIDRKQSLLELCSNVSDVPKKDADGKIKKDSDGKPMTDKKRFVSELKGAKEFGQHLIILCEHGGQIHSLEDVQKWKNPRLKDSPLAMSGLRLYVVLSRLMLTYDFEIEFCDKRQTGKRIIELLKVKK